MGRRPKNLPQEAPTTPSAEQNSREMNRDSSQLASLIDSATTSPANELDLGLSKSIKQLVRLSDANVHVAFDLLMEKLKKNHAQIRYLALLVVDELFTRSKLFRSLLVRDVETFMLHSIGYRSECPLPPPANRATLLRAKSMEVLEKWNEMFGPHYKSLRLGYEYLKDTMHLQFPNLRQAAAQAEQRRKEREERSMALVQQKYNSLKEDFPALTTEIQSTLDQLDECFKILSGANKQKVYAAPTVGRNIGVVKNEDAAADDGFEEYNVKSLRHILEQDNFRPVIPCENRDNKPIFDTIRDLCRLIVSQHIAVTQGWMSVLMRVDTQDRVSHDLLLRRVIDIRNHLSLAKMKCAELGIVVQHSESGDAANVADEIIWEDGAVCKEEGSTVEQVPMEADILASEKLNHSASAKDTVNSNKNKSPEQQISSVRQHLLQEAPLLPWGSYLDRWGTEHAVPVNQRGLLLENHWGKVDYDALMPAEKVTELSMRASYYTPTQSEIPPCSAPLRNGGLCQRRDLRVCPLHGPVIPRDCHGNPIIKDSENSTDNAQPATRESKSNELDANLIGLGTEEEVVKAIAAKAVANIRRQDDNRLTKKRDQQLQTKRDREHNAAVLRDAALAHSAQGLGEILHEDLERFDDQRVSSGQQIKRAKASLKAMLHPKPTSKDRLAERLLTSQVADATIQQIRRDEEASYREAFANQW